MIRAMAFVLVALAAGCVSAMPGADSVVITGDRAMVANCRFIEQASFTTNGAQTLTPGTMQADTLTKLRNRAVEVGATHAVTTGPTGTNVMSITGDLYACAA